MKTSTPKPAEPKWYVVDAKDQTLGRLAARIAHVLRGKHKPEFTPHQLFSDHVIVVNAGEVLLTGKKSETKVYYTHSGVIGNLKKIPVARLLERKPETVLLRAVKGMLPRNRLKQQMLDHLHLFCEPEHSHQAQKPESFDILFHATSATNHHSSGTPQES